MKRYIQKRGRFGVYFFDQENDRDIDLEEVGQLINANKESKETLIEMLDRIVASWDRVDRIGSLDHRKLESLICEARELIGSTP